MQESKTVSKGFPLEPIAMLVFVLVAALVTFAVVVGRHPSARMPGAGKVRVVASFYPLYFLAAQIGGEKAEVTNITPAGAEPHDYEPTAKDVAAMEDADLIILNGGGLESWGESVRQNTDASRTLIVDAGEGLLSREVVDSGRSAVDPHIWLSPKLALRLSDRIAAAYAKVDPADAELFRANADALNEKLRALDAEFAAGLGSCARRDVVTSHAAFGYLTAAYGLTQVSIAGLSPDAEPSPQQLADMAAYAAKNGVKYVFFESLVSPKFSDTIATEVGAKTLVLNPLEGLTPQEIADGNDYFTVMRANLANLKTALACPAR